MIVWLLLLVLLSHIHAADVYKAVAVLTSTDSTSDFLGQVTFLVVEDVTTVTIEVSGITTNPTGLHAISIHQFGDLRGFVVHPGFVRPGSEVTGGLSLGSNFNPLNESHGCPGDPVFQIGDLGNWQSTGGIISASVNFTGIELVGESSIIGRSIALNALEDNCSDATSSGDFLAVGVIGLAQVSDGDTNLASAAPSIREAVCVFEGTSECGLVAPTCTLGTGIVTLSPSDSGLIIIAQLNDWNIQSGFHIHTYGQLGAVGSHLDLDNQTHGLPLVNPSRHTGDLGYLFVENETAYFNYEFQAPGTNPDNELTLANVLGRSMVVHALKDNGDGLDCAETTGGSGSLIFECIIGIQNNQADQPDPMTYLPVPQQKGLFNIWTPSSCNPDIPNPPPLANPQLVHIITSDRDCINDQKTYSVKASGTCQTVGDLSFRVQCKNGFLVNNSVACRGATCSGSQCVSLNATPGTCTSFAYDGGAYTYTCGSDRSTVLLPLLLLLLSFSLIIFN